MPVSNNSFQVPNHGAFNVALQGPMGPPGPAGATGPTGATGSTGPEGPEGQVEVYEQPAEPVTTEVGALWIDTDQGAPLNLSDAPIDGQQYARKDAAWTVVTGGGGGSGTPGGATTQIQFNDAGAFGGDVGLTYNKTTDTMTLGSLALANGGKVTTPGIGTFESTGGAYGTARMTLMMESGVAGTMFETVPIPGAELVDFVFKTTGGQDNFRYERRTSQCIASNNYEFQIGPPSTPHFRIGNVTVVSTKPIELPANPVANLHAATKQYVDSMSGGTPAWGDITGKPATFPPSTHSHPTSEVTGLDAALAAKADLTYVNARTPQITVASTAPGSPATGDVWIDTT